MGSDGMNEGAREGLMTLDKEDDDDGTKIATA